MSGEEVLLGSWELLPEHLLVSIFLYLTPAQRLLAALACKAWSTCLNHPQLWRQFVCSFTLPHHEKVTLVHITYSCILFRCVYAAIAKHNLNPN